MNPGELSELSIDVDTQNKKRREREQLETTAEDRRKRSSFRFAWSTSDHKVPINALRHLTVGQGMKNDRCRYIKTVVDSQKKATKTNKDDTAQSDARSRNARGETWHVYATIPPISHANGVGTFTINSIDPFDHNRTTKTQKPPNQTGKKQVPPPARQLPVFES